MKLLKKLSKRSRNKKQGKLEEIAFHYQLEEGLGKKTPKLSKNFISQQIEMIHLSVSELDEARQEYGIVTKYLTDMQIIEDISIEEKEKIKDVANNIITMKQTRDLSMKIQKKISDAQYTYFSRLKDDIPTSIGRLKENEEYQNRLKRDLDILEGEKASLIHEKIHLEKELVWIKKLAISIFILFALFMIILAVMYFFLQKELPTTLLISVFLGAIAAFALFLRRQNDEILIKQAVVNYNYAINLQNKVKYRYVSITNAVDYAKEYYRVKNSYDFSFQWNQYLEAVKERERLDKTNDDLGYFYGLLMRHLAPYYLYDRNIWESQAKALVDPKEMVELRHELIQRRQKSRSRIETQFSELEHIKNEFLELMEKNSIYDTELAKITKMIDQILENKS